jgi:Rho-binding antiterminator
MEKSNTIACQLYDYVEIACMYKLHVKAVFKNGDEVEGQAINTGIVQFDSGAQECLLVKTQNDENLQTIVLGNVVKLVAVTENPHFSEVYF